MDHKRHYVIHAILAVLVVVALVAVFTGVGSKFHSASKPGQVFSTSAQQNVAEAAAVADNKDCHPAIPAHLGSCAPRQALSLANAIAPNGDSVPTHNSSPGGISALIEPPNAYASTPVDRGEDVSSYQGCGINWSYRKRYLSFAIFKGVEGGSYSDQCLASNVASAKRAGLYLGTYEFFRDNVSPEFQADREVNWERASGFDVKAPGSLPHTVDVETNDAGYSTATACGVVVRYINRYERDTGRHQMSLYTSEGTSPIGYCAFIPLGTILWDASYGPVWNNLTGLTASIWQYSDGTFGPIPHLDGGDSDVWLRQHSTLVSLANSVPPISPPTSAQYSECGKLRYLRNHGQGSVATTIDLRNSLAANLISCNDSSAQHYANGPSIPQPSPDEFRMCRQLIAWRNTGRPAAQLSQEATDRRALVSLHISCNGRPPIIAVHF